MSRYPSATWRPIANRSTKALQKDLLSLHTCVGSGLGTWNYFNTGAGGRGVYSHIVVCGIWGSDADKDVDGLALQMQDTDLRAAANYDGNWHIISVETADNAERPIAPWTKAQQDTLVQIMVDANRVDGIPLALVPDSKPGRRGISYHRMGCDPYRVAGGELWSTAYGKDCPTQARIDQIPGLIARARAIVAGEPEDDMPAYRQWDPADKQALLDDMWRMLSQGKKIDGTMPDHVVDGSIGHAVALLGDVKAEVDALAPPDPTQLASAAGASATDPSDEA